MTLCDDIRAAQSELDTVIRELEETPIRKSVIEYGNEKLSEILKPLIELEEEAIEKIYDPRETERIADSIRIAGTKKTDPLVKDKSIGVKLVTALKGDQQVREAVRAMTDEEYAITRDWIARMLGGEYGGDSAARTFEQTRKTMLYNQLKTEGLPETIQQHLTDIMSKGFLADGDVELFNIVRTRSDDLVKVLDSQIYKGLSESDKQLDTFSKLDNALSAIYKYERLQHMITNGELTQKSVEIANAMTTSGKIDITTYAKLENEAEILSTLGEHNIEDVVETYTKLSQNMGKDIVDELIKRKAREELNKTSAGTPKIIKEHLEEISTKDRLTATDARTLNIVTTRADEINKISTHASYRGLTESEQKLDTANKIENALLRMSEYDDTASMIANNELTQKSLTNAKAQLNTNKINPTDVMKWRSEAEAIRTLRISPEGNTLNAYNTIAKTHGKEIADEITKRQISNDIQQLGGKEAETFAKNKLNEVISKAALSDRDIEVIEIVKNRQDDIERILRSKIYNGLSESDKQLDTFSKLEKALMKVDEYKTIEDAVTNGTLSPESLLRARAQLSAGTLNAVDAAKWVEESNAIKNFDGFPVGAEKATYDTLKRAYGNNVADELLRREVNKVANEVESRSQTLGKTDTILGKKLNADEEDLIARMLNGESPKLTDLESVEAILNKISPQGWDAISVAMRRFDTIAQPDMARAISGGNAFKILTSKKAIAVAGTGIVTFVLLKAPGYYYEASFQQQQAFESTFQFGSFQRYEDTAETLLSKYFGKDEIQKATLISSENLIRFYEMVGKVPIYGQYFQSMTSAAYASNMGQLGNLEDIYNHLVDRGLAEKCNTSPTGYCETTEEKRLQIYRENEKALFDNDVGWINKYGEKIYGAKGFSSDETPFRRPMSAVEVAAYKHHLMGDGVISQSKMNAMGLGDLTSSTWKKENPTFVQSVMNWGGKATGTEGIPSGMIGTEMATGGYYTTIPLSEAQTYQEKQQIANAHKSFESLKNIDKNASLTEYANLTGMEDAVIKQYLSSNLSGATLKEINEAFSMDKVVTANAILTTAGGIEKARRILSEKGMSNEEIFALLYNAETFNTELRNTEKELSPEVLRIALDSTNPTIRESAIKRLESEHMLTDTGIVTVEYMARELGFEEGDKNGFDYVMNKLKDNDKSMYESTIATYAKMGWTGPGAEEFWTYVENNYDARSIAVDAIQGTTPNSAVLLYQIMSGEMNDDIVANRTALEFVQNEKKNTGFDIEKLISDTEKAGITPYYGVGTTNDTPEKIAVFVASGHERARETVDKMAEDMEKGISTDLIKTLNELNKWGVNYAFGSEVSPASVVSDKALRLYDEYNGHYSTQEIKNVKIEDKYDTLTMSWTDALGKEHTFEVVDGNGYVWNPTMNNGDGGYDKTLSDFTKKVDYDSGKWTFNKAKYAELLLSRELDGKTTDEYKQILEKNGISDPLNEDWWSCSGALCEKVGMGTTKKATVSSIGGGGGGGGGSSGGYTTVRYVSSTKTSTTEEKDENVLYVECNVDDAIVTNTATGVELGKVNTSITLTKGAYTIKVSASGYVSRETPIEIGNYPVAKTITLSKIPPSISTFINGLGGIQYLTKEMYLYLYCIYKMRRTSNYEWKEYADTLVSTTIELPTMIAAEDVMYIYHLVNGDISSAQALVDAGKVTLLSSDGTPI